MLSNIDDALVSEVWHKDFFNARKAELKDANYKEMIGKLDELVQECMDRGDNVVVSSFIPGSDWRGSVWQPIYDDACGQDFEHSAMFFGLLVQKVLIDREEKWYFLKQDNVKGMIYFQGK